MLVSSVERPLLPTLPSLGSGQALRLAREYLNAGRAAIDAAFDAGLPASEAVRQRAALYDRLLVGLFQEADHAYCEEHGAPDARLTLCAVGGYGRGELSPASDLDLLFLFPYEVGAYVEVVSERLLYWLWDLSLEVGSSVRSIDGCVRLAKTDLSAYTSLLDHRYLAGDPDLYAELDSRLFRAVFSRGVSAFLQMREREDRERRERYADTVYLLEPHVKQGEGGLRDLHQALWAAHVRFHVKGLDDLLRLGAVSEREAQALRAAHEFLLAVREVLHRTAGRKQDRLTFDVQEQIAREFGHRDTERALAVEQFMQRYYQAARTVRHHAERILERCAISERRRKPARGTPVGRHFRIFNGALTVQSDDIFRRHPEAIMEIFHESMVRNLPLYPYAKDLLAESTQRIGADLRRDPAVAARFLEILTHPADKRGVLREMHDLGVLGAYLPEFGRLTGKHQHTIYHVYTVDVHTLTAIERLKALHRGELAKEVPHVSEVMAEVERPRTLYLALLFHDIGKGTGRDHSEVGAEMATRACERLGLAPEEIAEVAFLVRRHLAMVILSTRRDMHEEALLESFCAEIGDIDLLRKLYVLTYADSVTTGPNIWSDWKAMLVRELYDRAHERMRGQPGAFNDAETVQARRAESRALLASTAPAEEVEAFLVSMPDRYFLAFHADTVATHFALARRLGEAAVAIEKQPFPDRGYTEVILTCKDRPGLLALLTGGMTANGIDILGALIYTRTNGEALDVFYVRDRNGQPQMTAAKWRRFTEALEGVLTGATTVEALMEKSQKPSTLDKAVPRVRTKVVLDPSASTRYNVIDVYTQDRLGVLYLITRTLFELGLTIGLSKVATEGNRVVDAFYVADVEGGKIADPERLSHIQARLVQALEGGAR
jgi:[protein-PII] uridylyltransferase